MYSARVLILLYLEGSCSVGELAEEGVARSVDAFPHILRRLHESGLVDKASDHDSRTVMATLTEAGEVAGKGAGWPRSLMTSCFAEPERGRLRDAQRPAEQDLRER